MPVTNQSSILRALEPEPIKRATPSLPSIERGGGSSISHWRTVIDSVSIRHLLMTIVQNCFSWIKRVVRRLQGIGARGRVTPMRSSIDLPQEHGLEREGPDHALDESNERFSALQAQFEALKEQQREEAMNADNVRRELLAAQAELHALQEKHRNSSIKAHNVRSELLTAQMELKRLKRSNYELSLKLRKSEEKQELGRQICSLLGVEKEELEKELVKCKEVYDALHRDYGSALDRIEELEEKLAQNQVPISRLLSGVYTETQEDSGR